MIRDRRRDPFTGDVGTPTSVVPGADPNPHRRSDPAPPGQGRWSRVLFLGDDDARRTFAHTVLARLAVSHPAGDLLIALCVSPPRRSEWAWTRWLPHLCPPPWDGDQVAAASGERLPDLLGARFAARPPFALGARPDPAEPLVVMVLDGGDPPAGESGTVGLLNTVVFDLDGRRRRPGRTTLRLDIAAESVRATWTDADRRERSAPLADATAAAALLTAVGPRPAEPGTAGHRLAQALDDAETGHPWQWPPPLTAGATIDHLLPPLVPTPDRGLTTATPPDGGPVTVPVGVVDRPFEPLPDVLKADTSGHVLVIGGAGSGRSTLVTTLVIGLGLTHTPRETQFYCLDLGGSLGPLAGLPHVGAVIGPADTEGSASTIAKVTGLLDHRERLSRDSRIGGMAGDRSAADPYGDVFLVVDGLARLGAHGTALDRLAADGPRHGLHLVVTAEQRPRTPAFETGSWRELSLDDPAHVPGRGRADGSPFLTALPRIDGVQSAEGLAGAVTALASAIAEHWGDRPGAPGVRPLPFAVPAGELPEPDGRLKVMLGVADGELAPVAHDFATAPHLVVIGEPGSGRTNLLRLAAWSITAVHDPGQARVLIVDYRGGLLDAVPEDFVLGHAFSSGVLGELVEGTARAIGERMPGPAQGPRDWHGPRLFILIDDYEQVGDPPDKLFEPLLDYLAMGYEVGAHLVVARSSSCAATADPLLRGLREAGAGILQLSCPPAEGDVLDGLEPGELPPGRGRYHAAGETILIQTALAD